MIGELIAGLAKAATGVVSWIRATKREERRDASEEVRRDLERALRAAAHRLLRRKG